MNTSSLVIQPAQNGQQNGKDSERNLSGSLTRAGATLPHDQVFSGNDRAHGLHRGGSASPGAFDVGGFCRRNLPPLFRRGDSQLPW